MKITVALLIILVWCFSVSAFAQDSSKVSGDVALNSNVVPGSKQDAPLKKLSLDDFSILDGRYEAISLSAVNYRHAEEITSGIRSGKFSLAGANYPDELNINALLKRPVALGMAESHLAKNPSNRRRIRNADSLRLLAIMIRQDSVKFANYRANKDSVKQRLTSMPLDSLKQQLQRPTGELFKAQIYTEIANRYLGYDTIGNKATRINYENKALNYTMLALHNFSYFNDTTGLRVTFDHLAKVYLSQKKYSQAKWFILQSNSLARAKKDTPNIISSLVTLAKIKTEQGDYKLATGDLDEALKASASKYQNLELDVLTNYAMLYSRLKNYPKEAAMLKKRDSLAEKIKKDEEARLMAALTEKNALEKKKADSAQSKKKALSSNTKKLKSGSGKKVATL
ncbi:MAG TPA: hypothetical protein VHA56_10020 [Mucilaginibacter sp.]|nr:hypothetical protein [Mucilaginibacter sp.]